MKVAGESNSDTSLFEEFDYGAVAGMEYELTDEFLINAWFYLGFTEFNNQLTNLQQKIPTYPLVWPIFFNVLLLLLLIYIWEECEVVIHHKIPYIS